VKAALLYGPVQEDLALVEDTLQGLKEIDFPALAQMMELVLSGGGKRLRPALVLLASRFGDYNLEPLVPLAASVELLHAATLVHDDVIDNATTRRGRPTANSLHSNSTTVMLGDYMFAHAAELVARTGNIRVITLFAHTLLVMAKGEIRQDISAYDSRQSVRDYLARIAGKTASLFATACEGGAIISGQSGPQISALQNYGYNLGMAFQIVDDILDFTGDEAELGKPIGSDLLQGTLTLPSLLLVERYPHDNPISQLFGQPHKEHYLQRAVEMIRNSDIPDEAYQLGESFCRDAYHAMDALPDTPARRTLQDLTEHLMERRS
jgi:geranylgeranyl pyrophosphate synthase